MGPGGLAGKLPLPLAPGVASATWRQCRMGLDPFAGRLKVHHLAVVPTLGTCAMPYARQ